jgi:hypothetical protein
MNAHHLKAIYQPGDEVRVRPNRWGMVEAGDTGTISYQHHEMMGGVLVPAGWVIKASWRWTWMRVVAIIIDFVMLRWKQFKPSLTLGEAELNHFHLFEEDFELINVE